jgi:hypothetical protein
MTIDNDHGFSGEPIEEYLDHLLLTLTGSPRSVRHTLAEVEAHLRDSAAAGRRDGLDEIAAERLAVERMGSVLEVRDDRGLAQLVPRARRRSIVLVASFLGAIGGIAIGAAGLIAGIARVIGGDSAIATPFPSGSYSAADCRRWMNLYPRAGDCVTAMTIDHASDFLRTCAVAGLAGVFSAIAFMLLRRRWNDREVANALPRSFADSAGALLSALVALAATAQAADIFLVTRGEGAWQPLSLAIAAAAACFYFAVRVMHQLTQRPLLQVLRATRRHA